MNQLLAYNKRFDHYFLIHYPIIWSIKAHYIFFISLVFGNLMAIALGCFIPIINFMMPVFNSNGDPAIYYFIYNLMLVGGICLALILLFWAIYLQKNSPRITSIKKYNIISICCSSIGLNLLLFLIIITYRVAQLGEDEKITAVEKIFLTSYYCKGGNTKDYSVKLDDNYYELIPFSEFYTTSSAWKRLGNLTTCKEEALKLWGRDIIYIPNKNTLGVFLEYIQRYDLLDNPDGPNFLKLGTRDQRQLEDYLRDNNPNIEFPIVLKDYQRASYFYAPQALILKAKKGIFFTWPLEGFLMFWCIIMIGAGFIFLFSENTVAEFSMSFFISTVIALACSVFVQDFSIASIFISGVFLLLLLWLIIKIVRLLFTKKSRSLQRIWINTGFFYIVMLLVPISFSLVKLAWKWDKELIHLGFLMLLTMLFIIISNIYFFFFVARKEKLPSKI